MIWARKGARWTARGTWCDYEVRWRGDGVWQVLVGGQPMDRTGETLKQAQAIAERVEAIR